MELFQRNNKLKLVIFATALYANHSRAEILEEKLKEVVSSGKAPSIVFGVYSKNETKFYSFGLANVEKNIPASPKTQYAIGSVTKTFTTTLLSLLAEDGKVALSDPIEKYLPASINTPSFNGAKITLLDLATRTSGLPNLPSNFDTANEPPFGDYSTKSLYEYLNTYQLTRSPGEKIEYSNVGMGLLGLVLSQSAQKPYQKLLNTYINAPLKLKSTYILSEDLIKKSNLARGYENGKATVYWTWTTDSALAPAGGIVSSAEDLMRYSISQFDSKQPIHWKAATGKARTPLKQKEDGSGSVGLGWNISADGTVWHTGSVPGFFAIVAFDPKSEKAVVGLTNSYFNLKDLAFDALKQN